MKVMIDQQYFNTQQGSCKVQCYETKQQQQVISRRVLVLIITLYPQIKQNLMNKNSLLNILFESNQRQSQKKLGVPPSKQQKNNSKIQFPQNPMQSINGSNKMIKITQFNSSIAISEDKLFQRGYKTSYSNSPQKNFNIKKISEFKTKVAHNAQKIIEIEIKKREKGHHFDRRRQEEQQANKEAQKLMITSKWSIKSESNNVDYLINQVNVPCQTVVVIRPVDHSDKFVNPLELSEQIILGRSKEILAPKQTKINSSKDKTRPKMFIDNIPTINDDICNRKFSASPRKNYNKHINDQKKFQENIEKEKREMLQMKKELNKNYAKPFNPPDNVTAFSYIIYEADVKRNGGKLRKYSAKRHEAGDLNEIRKMFLHSHQVIVSLNSRTAVEMASLTKIMTCIIALDLSKRYNLKLSEQFVTIGLFEQNVGGTSANIKKGEIYTIEQLLYGLMLPSGNDASLALAVWGGRLLLQREAAKKDIQCSSISTATHIGQEKPKPKFKKRESYERFVQEMNNKAAELNMEKTKYSNSHGLSNPENRSCAFDLGILCEYCMNSKQFRQIVGCKVYETEIKIEGDQMSLKMQKEVSKESRKSLKKKLSMNINREGIYEMQEMKDMDEMIQNFEEDDEESDDGTKAILTKTVRWENTHQLLQQKPELYIGIKTGITNTAGPCLASCIEIKGRRFIIIVLNCKNMKFRMKDTQSLRRWLFNKESIKYSEKIVIEQEVQ